MEHLRPILLSILLFHILLGENNALSPDGEALLIFKTAILGSDGILLQWKQEDADPCGWKGVKCDAHTKRVIYLSLPQHKLSGSISPEIGKLNHLKVLALHNNNLFGTIPSELANCTELRAIYLQGNYLSGSIPSDFGDLPDLEFLDVSSNSLSGSIPSSLGKLSKLSILNVSTNFLSGQIPPNIKFTENSFVGNRGLCGTQITITCKDEHGGASLGSQPNNIDNINGKKKSGTRLLISALATVGALLLVALMCFWGCFLYKKFGKNDTRSLAMDVIGGASIVMFHGDLPYSSKDIIKKLENLSEEHIIGSGGFGKVYKLAMDDGSVFALKRIMKTNEGLDRFFERELEILGSIKHRYLVNLRGYCNSPSSKLLIYDYLPGGSLDEALHERSELLDWDARLNIIMGAAKEDEESHITTIVAGTFGYLAPEYMLSGRATEKSDVYSFGVLVLEILSGKRPTDASFIEKGLNIVGWLNFLVAENRPREIVDQHCEGIQTESLDTLLLISIQCVSSSPEDRPTMHRVVQILEAEINTPCPSDFYDSSSD
ncbi:hypothetical protein MKW98_014598 [Papaver atlanticum]|uniref:Protein kinase domain-containing protein n=1 Tax=Papaver atlanticum TaxID=357466 RepID=A0AAD4SF46_9MAGN|nr:hypothetical protein MKW98_014598 [Papaver atlanticum]